MQNQSCTVEGKQTFQMCCLSELQEKKYFYFGNKNVKSLLLISVVDLVYSLLGKSNLITPQSCLLHGSVIPVNKIKMLQSLQVKRESANRLPIKHGSK